MSIKYLLFISLLLTNFIINAAELINLTPDEVNNKLTENALVIDIRTPQEWQSTGIIPGSHPVKFFDQNGKYDAEQWLATVKQLQTSPDQEIILVCRSGGRSNKVGNFLTQKRNMPNISHLQSGITSWIKEKRPTDSTCTATQSC